MNLVVSNRISMLLLFLLIAGISGRCQSGSFSMDIEGKTFRPLVKSSLRPDSVWSVSLAKLPKNSFAFSPLDTDRVWMLGFMRDPYQIDLKTGEYTLLASIIGSWSQERLDQNWTADPLDPNVLWFVFFREGLVRFHRDTRQFELIPSPGQAVLSIEFLGDQIWVGRSDGLARYDRLSGKLVKDSVFIGRGTSALFTLGDSLIVNNERYYHPTSGQSGHWALFGDNSTCEPFNLFIREQGLTLVSSNAQQNWIINHRTGSMFQRGQEFPLWNRQLAICYPEIWIPFRNGLKYLDAKTGSLYEYALPEMRYLSAHTLVVNHASVWVPRPRDLLYFQKSDTSFHVLPERWRKNLRQMECDDYNLYLLFEDRFEVVSIEWLITQGIPLRNVAREEVAVRAALKEMKKAGDFYQKEKQLKEISARFSDSQYPSVRTILDQARERLYAYSGDGADSIVLFMERALQDRHFSPPDETLVRFGLYNFYGGKGLLKKAAYHAKQVSPSLLSEQHQSDFSYSLPQLLKAKRRMDSLHQLKLRPDHQLFEEGKILYDYCASGLLWFRNSNYYFDLSLDKYDLLLKKYPQSRWADNATYEKLKSIESASHEGGSNGDNLKSCQLYRQLLRKYPTTELKPEIWLKMARLYLEAELPKGERRLKYVLRSAALLDSIRAHFPTLTSSKSFSEINRRVTASREANAWDISFTAKNTHIQAGQAVVITVRLKNKDSRTHTLKFTEPLNDAIFAVNYSSDNDCKPVPVSFWELENELAAPKRTVEVAPGKSHQFEVELTRRVLSQGKIVRFPIDKPGIYIILGSIVQAAWGDAAHYMNEPLQQIQITVD